MTTEPNTTILTIDDEAVLRQSISIFLENRGFTTLEAEDGYVGLEVFRREKPDMVLVDLRMPKVDGIEVLENITRESPDTPVIVVSGTGRLAQAVKALRLGAWDYIVKPITDMDILHHAIEKSLERACLIKENRRYSEHLEEEVEKKTRELKATNERLIKEIDLHKQAEEELEKHREHLEEVVRERTAELEKTNEQLEQQIEERK